MVVYVEFPSKRRDDNTLEKMNKMYLVEMIVETRYIVHLEYHKSK